MPRHRGGWRGRLALDDLTPAEMVTRGDIVDQLHDNVAYSLRIR
ncbi:hypothetical protein [Streptomyces lunaelactis]|nr:hypothetical protein [Streptomyces lunaelactis]